MKETGVKISSGEFIFSSKQVKKISSSVSEPLEVKPELEDVVLKLAPETK